MSVRMKTGVLVLLSVIWPTGAWAQVPESPRLVVQTGHSSPVLTIGYSEDGKPIAIGHDGGNVELPEDFVAFNGWKRFAAFRFSGWFTARRGNGPPGKHGGRFESEAGRARQRKEERWVEMLLHRVAYLILACAVGQLGSASFGAASSQPRKIFVNFQEIDASHDVVAASPYLRSKFKITLSDVTPGTQVVIVNDKHMYDAKALKAVSGNNVLTQINSNDPVTFTLNFAEPMQRVQFTRPTLLAGVTGITFPEWRAQALDKNGKNVGQPVGEPLGKGKDYYQDVPAKTFTLEGPGITSVRFSSDNHHFAAFSAVVIDDLTLETEGEP